MKKAHKAVVIGGTQRDGKGRFIKGTKAAGRPVGAVNATTREIRQAFQNILANQEEQIYKDLATLSAKDRLAWIASMSGLILPRMSALALTDSDGATNNASVLIDWFGETD